jgi:penicillin-binding protein 2
LTGVEWGFDSLLRGRAGGGSVMVNSVGYRQSENISDAPEPGHNVVLTIDLDLQSAAAAALAAHQGAEARAAIVVMDVRNGDVLAMVSSPAFDPDYFTGGLSAAEFQAETAFLNNTNLRPLINRATQENYAPGSIFKPVIGLAALEAGLDPKAEVDNPGYIYVGARHITDLARPGKYNFRRAIMDSSNTYFITNGLHAGIDNIIRLAEKFHFGERAGLPTRQDARGNLPTMQRIHNAWRDGDTANICIGQGEVAITPLQMAVAYSAIANGGKVFWPRLVERIEPQDPTSMEAPTNFPAGLVRDHLGVRPENLRILHDAMLAETEDPEGTGGRARVPGMHICGKTGTAEIMDPHNKQIGKTTWFASFAPYESPRYAVVVMVENGFFGGPTCGPIAHDIYAAILAKEKSNPPAVASARRDEQTIQ